MTTNELLLLGLLGRHHMHGYELHEILERQLGFLSDLKRPTAYRLLGLLHAQGLVERHVERRGRRPERRVYRLTARGRTRFEELLRAELAVPAHRADPGNVALLFTDELPAEERKALLDQRLASLRARREHLASLVALHASGATARLVLEHDLARADFEIAWLSEAAARIAGLESPAGTARRPEACGT